MKVILPKDLNNKDLVPTDDMECNKVYSIANLLVCHLPSGCFIVIDTSDNEVLTFNDYDDINEWLTGQDYSTKGELTPFQMQLSVK